MLLQKPYIHITAIALFIALVFFGIKVIHHEWRSSYTILFQKTYYKVNLLDLKLKNIFERIYRPLMASRKKGLPKRQLYISKKAQNFLMENIPENIKKWQRAFLVYPDGQLRRVRARHRGDAPVNWALNKKSWRVKLPKSALINNSRVFNFTVPQETNQFENYLPHYLGNLTGVLSPRMKLVELFINNKSQGILHETEHIDESFLRNNRLMPINIYKGEQTNRERQVMISGDLYDNAELWSKISTFNQVPETDFSDLKYVLDLIHQAETSNISLTKLKRVVRYEDWARFSAFQTLVQSWHNGRGSNARLAIDPWKGSVRPIVHDTLSLEPLILVDSFTRKSLKSSNPFDIVMDGGVGHPIFSLYHSSSDFLVKKYSFLYEFVQDDLILKAAQHFETLLSALERSFSRDYFRFEKIYSNDRLATEVNRDYNLSLTHEKGMRAEWEKFIKVLQWFQETLRGELTALPVARWLDEETSIGLIVGGVVPLNRVTLEFSQGQQIPKSIAWDADGNGRLSSKDTLIPFRVRGRQLELDAVWTTNRVNSNHYPDEFLAVPTQFQLVAEINISPIALRASNFLTGEMFLLASEGEPGNSPSRRNTPVIEKTQNPIEIWSENRTIEGTHLIDWPVRILPGTTIRMGPGANLVFRNQIHVEGRANAPVRIISDVLGEPWGTVALHGPDTAGSVLSHLTIENGSGASIGNVRYIGMLSIHEARDVEFKNLILRNNHKFDDMVHVIYSEDIYLRNCVFERAFSDALDVDISTIRIQGCRFSGSGNDAVDLMNSKALIMASELSYSGDKGVSVGEDSEVVIYNSRLHHNVNGIESKDGSVAYAISSVLTENKRQINAYQKNWRYGSGGKVVVDKSVFSSVDNSIKGDQKSDIKIYDSTFMTGFGAMDKQVKIDSLSDDTGEQKAASADYQPITTKALQSWGVKGNAGQRGLH